MDKFEAPSSAVPQRSHRLFLAALAVVTIAGGTAGGAVAGRSATPTTFTASIDVPNIAPAVTSVDAPHRDVSALIKQVLPSVVSIHVTLSGQSAAGTGFVISKDGEIVTNAHVVADATAIDVKFSDGNSVSAKILGIDKTDDLAVIKVDRSDLIALPLGSSGSLSVGEEVVAIGNALDLTGGPTATEGIVSALNRSIDTSTEHLNHLLQTDAAINPGNSGGPLLTLDGKVVGISSARSTDAQNIGFAIAIDTAKPIISQLQAGQTVTKAFLGVSTVKVDPAVAAQSGLDVDHGLLVVDVTGGSAAESAGLVPGDVILKFNGTTVDDPATFGDLIRTAGAGTVVHLTIHRSGSDVEVEATLSSHAA
ncbi:N/A [soil metagenome]